MKRQVFAVLLVIATFAAFFPAWHGQPIWDDEGHITRPELRDIKGLGRIWFELGATQQYYPVVHSLFWIEHKIWGDRPLGTHLVNILLHGLSGLLVVKILYKLGVRGGLLAGALFCLHPVHVESVAWMTELKNTLSGFLYLAAMERYLDFDRTRSGSSYASSAILFLLSLGSKSVTATLPAALLVIFWWQRGRVDWRGDVRPLIPFFGVAGAAGLFTAWVERVLIGAQGQDFDLSWVQRMLVAGRAPWFYLGKLVWPHPLMFIYPRWDLTHPTGVSFLYPLALVGLGLALWMERRRSRAPLACFLFFVGTLFPALGFLNVYPFRFSFVADHFQYLASLGPIALAAGGIFHRRKGATQRPKVAEKMREKGNREGEFFNATGPLWDRYQSGRWGEGVRVGLGSVLILPLGLLTFIESRNYSDSETLYRALLKRNPSCWLASNNLAGIRMALGCFEEAKGLCLQALQSFPDYPEALNNLGGALYNLGAPQEAKACCLRALRLKPGYADAHANLGSVLIRLGEFLDAKRHLGIAFSLNPFSSQTCNALSWLLATCPEDRVRDGTRAVSLAERALSLEAEPPPALIDTLAAAYAEMGRFEEAARWQEQALKGVREDQDRAYAGRLALYRSGMPYREDLREGSSGASSEGGQMARPPIAECAP